jgi:hypothetical protein
MNIFQSGIKGVLLKNLQFILWLHRSTNISKYINRTLLLDIAVLAKIKEVCPKANIEN